MCEVASHIKDNSEKYRHLFTDSSTKKDIIVRAIDPEVLPLHDVAIMLHKLLPVGGDAFLIDFSTSTPLSRVAFSAAFCDAMSTYYNYMMFMCAFPQIKVEGEIEDWNKIIDSISKFRTYFDVLASYFDKVEACINKITDAVSTGNGDMFKTMFSLERCGSGGQVQVTGWIRDFYVKIKGPKYVNNFPSCVSIVEYKNLDTNKEYVMRVGLLSSQFDENNEFLIPEYGYAIYDK
jgi:hypothetical protein